jgi:hypothetical protein
MISDAFCCTIFFIRLMMPGPGFFRSINRWPASRRCQPMNGKLPSEAFAGIRNCSGSAVNRIGMS